MTFIYILGSGSKHDNDEIRYSIRSVVKHHPNARIVIVGEKPHWYGGEHHYVADESNCAYVNQWAKLEFACSLADEFVYMDDDFYLLEPFEMSFYTPGKLISKYKKVHALAGAWRDVVVATYEQFGDVTGYLIHSPLPIKSDEFLQIAQRYPNRTVAPSLVPRQTYCINSNSYPTAPKDDIKFRGKFKSSVVKGEKFFSIADRFFRQRDTIDSMYPNASQYEISKRLESDDKHEQTDIDYEIQS